MDNNNIAKVDNNMATLQDYSSSVCMFSLYIAFCNYEAITVALASIQFILSWMPLKTYSIASYLYILMVFFCQYSWALDTILQATTPFTNNDQWQKVLLVVKTLINISMYWSSPEISMRHLQLNRMGGLLCPVILV